MGVISSPVAVASPYVPGTVVTQLAQPVFRVLETGHSASAFKATMNMGLNLGNQDRPLVYGATKNSVEGNPGTPCLELKQYGSYRFRWAIIPGARTISVKVKQPANLLGYPTLVIKACSAVGLAADVVGTSAGGVDWVTIGPIGFTATNSGSVWVEMHNNCITSVNESDSIQKPAYFDHLVAT